jgi:hypothetical protein
MCYTIRLLQCPCTFARKMATVYKTPVSRRSRKSETQDKTDQDAKESDVSTRSPQLLTRDGLDPEPSLSRTQSVAENDPQPRRAVEAESSSAKRKTSTTAPWYTHKKLVITSHPDLSSVEQLILGEEDVRATRPSTFGAITSQRSVLAEEPQPRPRVGRIAEGNTNGLIKPDLSCH